MSWYNPHIEVVEADRGGCIVCGHPTGDCRGHSPDSVHIDVPKDRKKDPLATYTVPTRVFEETLIGKRMVRRLKYAVGDRIRPEEARKVGLLPPLNSTH